MLDSFGITRERFQLRNHSVGRRTGSVSRINRRLAPRGLPTIEDEKHPGVREQIVPSNSRIGVDLANDRREIAVDDESHWSFTAAAKDSRQRGRRRDYSVDVERHPYCLLPPGLATPAGRTLLCRLRLSSTGSAGPVLILIIVFIFILVVSAEDVCDLLLHTFECAFGLVLGTVARDAGTGGPLRQWPSSQRSLS